MQLFRQNVPQALYIIVIKLFYAKKQHLALIFRNQASLYAA